MSRSLQGAHVAITGASSGIGEAAARAFAASGARVYAIARRAERLDALAAEVPGVEPVVLDVTDRHAVFRFAAGHRCDVAIANAGVMQLGPFLDMPWEDIERQLSVNLAGLIHTLQAFGRPMRERGDGVLMPVSSIVGVQALPFYSAYCATKFGVAGLARSLHMELRGSGVDVVHVLPGATATELHGHVDPAHIPPSTRRRKRVPAEHVARAMVAAARRPRPVVLCDRPARALYFARRVAPWLVDAVIGRATRPR